jgi:hypothetical protein
MPLVFTPAAPAFLTAAMGLLTSWIYPIRGVVYLLTTPQLLQLVLRFLGEPWLGRRSEHVECASLCLSTAAETVAGCQADKHVHHREDRQSSSSSIHWSRRSTWLRLNCVIASTLPLRTPCSSSVLTPLPLWAAPGTHGLLPLS